ncbi:MAG: hypothetical protein HZC42_03620 [Candidatus Eisenbacteria bacterium]|nr:hypothetical protein [Candidatus Eisenbacteria bacterium]
MKSMVVWLGRRQALRVSAALHLLAWAALVWVVMSVLRTGVPAGYGWPFFSTVAVTTAVGALLSLEQKWAEDVNLAFFKVNVVVGFGVLAAVLTARAWGGF